MRIADWLFRARSRAMLSAQLLDEVVDVQLDSMPLLPPAARLRQAEQLAGLVELGQSYRHYARGWISRRELQRRCQLAIREVGDASQPDAVQFVDGE